MARYSTNLWLVVEDGEDDFLLLQRACSRLTPPPRLHWAKDGLEAKAYLARVGAYADRKEFPLPALILSDLKMPLMDGLELLDWVKHNRRLSEIPFILLTCSNARRDLDRAHELGADDYVVKPTELADLAKLLDFCVQPISDSGSIGRT